MLFHLYILIVVMALVASYIAIGRQHVDKSAAEEIVASGVAISGYSIAALASGNVEVVTDSGGIVAFGSTPLFWLWAGLAMVNILFVLVAPIEELMQSEGRSLWDLIGRGNT